MTRHKSRVARRSRHRARRGTRKQSGGWFWENDPQPADAAPGAPKSKIFSFFTSFFDPKPTTLPTTLPTGQNPVPGAPTPPLTGGRKTRHRRRSPRRHRK